MQFTAMWIELKNIGHGERSKMKNEQSHMEKYMEIQQGNNRLSMVTGPDSGLEN